MKTRNLITSIALIALTTTYLQAGKRITVNPTAIQRAEQEIESERVRFLKRVQFSGFKVKDMKVEDAFKVLSASYKRYFGTNLNVMFKDTKPAIKQQRISVDLTSSTVPITDIVYYICMNSGLNYRVDKHAIVVWQRKKKEVLKRY